MAKKTEDRGLFGNLLWSDTSAQGTERKAPSKKEKELLYKFQGGRCMCCGIKLDIAHMHSDHKIPIARNGSNEITNKQLLCGPCNTRKSKMTDGEFRKRYPFLLPTSKAISPPNKAIPQSMFRDRDEEIKKNKNEKAKKQAKSKKDGGLFGNFFSG
jgi:hypothetical protein